MNYSLECKGGIGKHICFTSFIKWINEKFPKSKINIFSAYPEMFEYNPRVHRNLRLGQPYSFEDYIKGTDFRKGEPYACYDYYKETGKKHLMNLFPKAYGFGKEDENPEMEIYLTKGEEMDGQMFCQQNFPLVTFQGFGGLPPGITPGKDKVDSSQRDLNFDLSQKIVNILVKNGLKVLQVRSNTEPIMQNTMQLNVPFRNILPILKHSMAHIGIDSAGMHGAAVFKKPMLIFWGQTHVDNLGYTYEGVTNLWRKGSMHCRPHIQLIDNEGVFPYKDKFEGFEFDYSDGELEQHLNKFLNFLKPEGKKCRTK